MSIANVAARTPALGNISQYTHYVETLPRLEASEERELAERLQRDHDLDAARTLIMSHLRYVVYIARGYTGYGLPQEDLIQEGNIGLMNAVRRYDPNLGVRLVAYAGHWIRAHIHEYVLKNWRIVKFATTKAKRKLFYKLRSAKKQLAWLKRSEAEQIASNLGVNTNDVFDMEAQLYLPDQSFDAPVDELADNQWHPADALGDETAAPHRLVRESEFMSCAADALHESLDALDVRSRDIIESRWLAEDDDKLTLHHLADRYGVSAERIRQIEVAAISKMRENVVAKVGVDSTSIL